MHEFEFKKNNTLKERQDKALRVLNKYTDRVPVICERAPDSKIAQMDRSKILVPKDLSVAQFIKVIRKRIKLKPEETIYLFINDKLVSTSSLMSQVYHTNKDKDGFLYVSYSAENYFG
mmetsp:Transcript_92593/g.113405  ORF Transcript_92593/g.113405 Transcript_92593/m.113405 type:complete len:118 (+) Transcript_92593:95-448(+)